MYTEQQRNAAVCREELDLIGSGNFRAQGYEECNNMSFLKVEGIGRFWDEKSSVNMASLMGDVLSGCVRYGVPFCYALIGDERGVSLYLGTLRTLTDSLLASLEGRCPGISAGHVSENPLRSCPRRYGGMFTGIPSQREEENAPPPEQIESICRGMLGRRFSYIVLASGLSNIAVTFGHSRLLEEMARVFELINRSITGGAQGNISAQHQDFASKNYFENLEALEQQLKDGMARGMWRVNGYFAADTPADARQLGNLVRSAYSGRGIRPEPLRILDYNSIGEVIPNAYMIADLVQDDAHPLSRWHSPELGTDVSLYVYEYQTLLSSDQLGTLCQLPAREFPGYYVDQYVEFDVSDRGRDVRKPVPLGEVCRAGRGGGAAADNRYNVEKRDLTRHALIIGITGGGKTNTTKSILDTLWGKAPPGEKVPFLVIESAKREYWELRNLKGFEDLLVFTLGAEASGSSIPYRINPFETTPGISLQTHIDYLLSTFKAAFDLFPPLPYVLESAVYEIYDDRGWDIVENKNRYGLTEYPTLTDLYNKVAVVVDRMGYYQEVQSNVKTALQARIHSLMIGGKGAMLDTPRSVPIGELLNRPVVLELEDIGDDETKSFVIGILMVQLYEYRKSLMDKGSKDLSHILMIEEAHRLLKKVEESGEGGGTRAKSVEFFCNLLAEIRTYGQGILIADQIPTKLAPDTIKNTNLKIVHRTVAEDDRETIGRAMNMTPEQIEYLSSLRRGYAAVYSEGDNRPRCVKFPLVESFYDRDRPQVLNEVRKKVQAIAENYDHTIHNHVGCTYCEHRCRYWREIGAHLAEQKVNGAMVVEKWKQKNFAAGAMDAFLRASYMKPLNTEGLFRRMCVFGAVLQQAPDMDDGARQQVLADYLRQTQKRSL